MARDIGFPVQKSKAFNTGAAYIRPELALFLRRYRKIADVLAGEEEIKRKRTEYLPMPNAEDMSPANMARYKAYLFRAVFYSVTARTVEGLIGQIFMRDPTLALPTVLEPLKDDASGDNITLEQTARTACKTVLDFGRGGILVDYPATDEPTTQQQLDDGDIRPTIHIYQPWQITNWRSVQVGGVTKYTLIVIYEGFEYDDDGFEKKQQPQYRELRLINGEYFVQVWKKENDQGSWVVSESYTPTDANGKPFKSIPFMFIGAVNNDAAIDHPPIEALANMNLAHYRNSADYEESCYILGQPTPVFSGLTEAWVKEVFADKPIALGSRAAVPLPVGGGAQLLQALPNTMVKEAMDAKERQMVALGAKLVEQVTVQRTATETSAETSSENSILSSIAKNVSAGMLWALNWAADFAGADKAEIEYTLSTEFDIADMSPDERAQTIREWQAGAIAFTEMRAILRKGGVASLDDEAAQDAIAEEAANAMAVTFNALGQPVAPVPNAAGDAPALPPPSAPGAGAFTSGPAPTPKAKKKAKTPAKSGGVNN